MAIFNTTLTCFGLVSLAGILYRIFKFVNIFFIRESSLPKYLHGDNASWGLVTGASDGIGFATARELLRSGFNVFLHGRNEKKLSGLAETLRQEFPSRKIDIIVADAAAPDTDFAAIAHQISSVTKSHNGRLTVLVNNVGGVQTKPAYVPLDKITAADIDLTIAINARFPTLLTAALLPQLKVNQPSLIITCGSNAGTIGLPYIVTYAATKAYCHNLVAALHCELACDNVTGVEVITSHIGNTTSAGNKSEMFGTITSEQCAKGMLARVGCGETLVGPHWVPALINIAVEAIPAWLQVLSLGPEMRKRREVEMKEMEAGAKGR